MDQEHREYLEDRGSHQLEVEAMERERGAPPIETLFDINVHADNIFINLRRGGYTFNEAVQLANAILSEVEIAQRGDTE